MSDKKAQSLARALETASQLILERSGDSISMAEISSRAHCSTATIYDAFCTKEGLLKEAMAHHIAALPWATIDRESSDCPLEDLLDYLAARIHMLSQEHVPYLMQGNSIHFNELRPKISDRITHGLQVSGITQKVRTCMDLGLLRAGEPHELAYILLAGTGYEPVVYRAAMDMDSSPRCDRILKVVVTPFVTDEGRERLDAYLDSMAEPLDRSEGPGMMDFLMLPGESADT
jgi:AcrR family transcriptional regulator